MLAVTTGNLCERNNTNFLLRLGNGRGLDVALTNVMALLAFAVAGEPLGNVTVLAGLTGKITGGLGCDCFFASYDYLHDQTSVRINFEHHLTFKNRINCFFGRVNNFFDPNSDKLQHR